MSSSKDIRLEVEGFLKGEMLIPGGRFGGGAETEPAPFPDGLEMLIPGGKLGTGDIEIPAGKRIVWPPTTARTMRSSSAVTA